MVGFNVGLIVGGISFGVGLAFKEILGNMIAGIMILYTKEFKLGDIIEVQSDQSYLGRIEEITIRYTIIRTLDLRQVILPNMTLITVPIKTFSAEPIIKLTAIFGVGYDSDTTKVIALVQEIVNSFEFVKEKQTTKVFVSNFAASYIEIKTLFSFDPNCGLLSDFAIGYINEKVGKAFTDNNINVPFNTITINFDKEADKQNLINNLPKQ
ncbi:MAG: mechanosensitive ion channel domain-containing protein [bacterium]